MSIARWNLKEEGKGSNPTNRGSTVNIASRMERDDVPGQVNISAVAYERIKGKFACIYRGEVHAKNVGEIDMCLVDHEIEKFERMPDNQTANKISVELYPVDDQKKVFLSRNFY